MNVSLIDKINQAVGHQKIEVLAEAIQTLQAQISLTEKVSEKENLDDQVELLNLADLAADWNTTVNGLRSQISRTLGMKATFKVGKDWVIRKLVWLKYLKSREL